MQPSATRPTRGTVTPTLHPNQVFRDALDKELRRSAKLKAPAPAKTKLKTNRDLELDRSPLGNDELRGIWLPRKCVAVCNRRP